MFFIFDAGTRYRVSINFVSPPQLSMPEGILHELEVHGVPYKVFQSIDPDVLAATDVAYYTRVQKERFASEEEYLALKGS